MKKKLTRIAVLIAVIAIVPGCASFHEKYKAQVWTPDSFNYTLQRDRETGDMSDYFGFSWGFK